MEQEEKGEQPSSCFGSSLPEADVVSSSPLQSSTGQHGKNVPMSVITNNIKANHFFTGVKVMDYQLFKNLSTIQSKKNYNKHCLSEYQDGMIVKYLYLY